MSIKIFNVFGALAESELSATQRAGRYVAQAKAEKNVPADVAQKLALTPADTLLDIGCGTGLTLFPLSALVASATGVDHPATVARLTRELPRSNIRLVGGNFPNVELSGRFSKILTYSVIQCLTDEEETFAFIDAALDLLEPEGRLLIGDMSNVDLRRRFHESEAGQRFQKEWERQAAAGSPPPLPDPDRLVITDGFVMRLLARLRGRGLHAWALPQHEDLPFGNTREDLLVVKP
jgi:cyclopropane fatty-acyl-phospholipid synthase-like methyltransferase